MRKAKSINFTKSHQLIMMSIIDKSLRIMMISKVKKHVH